MIPQPGYFGPGVSNYNVLQYGRNLLLSISSVFAITVNSIRENPRLGASCRGENWPRKAEDVREAETFARLDD